MSESVTSKPSGAAARVPKGRSPSYPGVSLRVAVDRASALYETHRRFDAPLAAITALWGYSSPTTGPASVTYAALKKFGLLEEDGSGPDRSAKLTELAVEILLNPEPRAAIQRAALLPPIHKEMWDEYGNDLPPDTTLYWRLQQRGFTRTGFQEFIREYRDTIEFAQLTPGGSNEPPRAELHDPAVAAALGAFDAAFDSPGPRSDAAMRALAEKVGLTPAPDSRTRIPIPLVGGVTVFIEGEFPIAEAAWENMLAVLQAMKPGLVQEPPERTKDLRPTTYDLGQGVRTAGQVTDFDQGPR